MTVLSPAMAITDLRPSAATAALAPSLDWPLADDAARAEHYAFRFGRAYDAYLVTEPGWEHFWSAGRQGMVAVARQGRYLFSSGGLLAPAAHQEELLRQLVDHAASRGYTLTFFNICEDQLPLFRKFGFQATKWGEEAVVDLPQCTWSGKSYEWVRRQTNFCRRHGLEFRECRPGDYSGARWARLTAELAHVSNMFLAGKPQSREMRFLQGSFDPRRLGQKRVFVAQNRASGRIEGFVACNPCGGRTWVMETCRQRPDAVRGTTAFIMHQAMQQFKAEGVLRVSLCLLPGLRCRQPHARRQCHGSLGSGDRHRAILSGLRNGRGLSLQESLPPALRKSLSLCPAADDARRGHCVYSTLGRDETRSSKVARPGLGSLEETGLSRHAADAGGRISEEL